MNKLDTIYREFDILSEEYTDEFFSEEQFKSASDSIIHGVNIDKEENSTSVESTLLSESNQSLNTQSESSSPTQTKSFKTENIKCALNYISKEYKSPICDSYYNEVTEYHGTVDFINLEQNTFLATLHLKSDPDKKISVEFSLDDVQYESEKSLIKIGAPLVWIVGQETGLLLREQQLKQGPRINISIFRFRRPKSLSRKQVQTAKEKANEWTKFFSGCQTED